MSRVCWFTAKCFLCAHRHTHADVFRWRYEKESQPGIGDSLCGVVTVSSPPFLLFLLSPLICRLVGRARTLSILYFPIACSNINNTPSNIHFKFFLLKKKFGKNYVIREIDTKKR